MFHNIATFNFTYSLPQSLHTPLGKVMGKVEFTSTALQNCRSFLFGCLLCGFDLLFRCRWIEWARVLDLVANLLRLSNQWHC